MLHPQVKYLDADGINFGRQLDSRDELSALEATIHKLMNISSYQAYSLEDWSLAVKLQSHICFPEGSEAVAVEFMVQVWHLAPQPAYEAVGACLMPLFSLAALNVLRVASEHSRVHYIVT
jgi:hypothetical protein